MSGAWRTRLTLLVLLMLTLLRIPVALAMRAMLPDLSVNPGINYVAAMVQSLMMFALPGWLLKPSWRAQNASRGERLGWLLFGMSAALAARAVATPVNAAWAGLVKAAPSVIPSPGGIGEWLLMALALAVVPAVAEEVFFRGALLPRLLQCASRTQALLLTTLMFALLHGSLAGLPGHLLISLLLTLLMMHSGRLLIPIMAHLLYNLTALFWPAATWLGVCCGILLAALLTVLMKRLPQGRVRSLPLVEGLLCGAVLLAMAAQYLI